MKEIIETSNAPAPIGPYSQAVKVGNMYFLSGQIAIDPATGNMVMDNLEAETHQVMKNIGAILTDQGMDYSNIAKTSIFLQSMGDFAEVNGIYGSYFSSDFPARETVEVAGLPKGVNVEISVIAVKG
ncbi:MAG: RidA family protein [Bacteroidota bacterium]